MSSHTHRIAKLQFAKLQNLWKFAPQLTPPEKLLLPSEINAIILTFLEVGNQINRSDSSHSNDPEPHW